MPTVSVNGIQMYYESTGTGPAVVFLHGYVGTTAMWKPQVEPISKKYRFITYDARGHGQTSSPSGVDQYSADIVAEDLAQLLRALKVEKAVIGGLSMGGFVSLRFYLRHPEMVNALIVMDTGPGYRNPERRAEWNQRQEERAQLLEKGGIAGFMEQGVGLGYTPRDVMLKHNATGLAHTARRVVGQQDALVMEVLPNIKVPTLVLVGERDKMFLQAADYMATTIPGARKAVIPNAGHASNLDNTPAFNQEVLSFLNSLKLR